MGITDSSLAEVWVADGHLQAEVIKGKLESLGIPVLLKYESLGLVMGLTVDGLGQVRVLVPAEYADDARQALEESDDDSMSSNAHDVE